MIPQTPLKLPPFFRNVPAWLFCAALAMISCAGYFLLAYGTPRANFTRLLTLFSTLFVVYGLVLVWPWPKRYVGIWLGLAVGFRLLLLLSVPLLSDDYARFVWDGRLLAAGFNPYLYLPSQLLHSPVFEQAGLSEALFAQLNSPQYFTVYPPFNQALFGVAAWVSDSNLLLNIGLLRTFILLAEIGTIWLLFTSKYPQRALIYALNPLVIIELTGNLHFEAVVVFFVLLAFRWLENRPVWSAGALVLAAGTKLLPLLFLPLLVAALGWRRGLRYGVLVGAGTLALFLPFLSIQLLQNMGSSLDLYFQKFEFNASFYYLIGAVGFWVKGYNIIQTLGPALSLVAAAVVVWLAFSKSAWLGVGAQGIFTRALLSLLVYYLGSTIVHPWYITTLVALGSFTIFRFPVVWSVLLPLTYAAYSSVPVRENTWFLAVEYTILLLFVAFEWPNLPQNGVSKGHKLGEAAAP